MSFSKYDNCPKGYTYGYIPLGTRSDMVYLLEKRYKSAVGVKSPTYGREAYGLRLTAYS